MGLEGLVSKRRDRPYQAGRSKDWIKVKNRTHPAMSRVIELFGNDKKLFDSFPSHFTSATHRCGRIPFHFILIQN